jgi:uncharacterized protein
MEPWAELTLFGVTIFFMLIGLVGVIIPIFPGIVIIWLSALGYGLIAGFNLLGTIMFILITLLMIAGVTVDNVLMGLGARRGGASWVSIVLATIAGVVGTLAFPPIGGFIAAPLVVLGSEFIRIRDLRKAGNAFGGLALGWGLSFLARFFIGASMIGLWVMWAIFR